MSRVDRVRGTRQSEGSGPANEDRIASRRAYDFLRAGILQGAYPFGARLIESDLGDALGISRTPIREALHQLQVEGLVRSEPNRGAYVAGWNEQDVAEIFDLRVLLEGHAAREAARSLTADHAAVLEALCREMEALNGSREAELAQRLTELNSRFHQVVIEATGNRRLKRVLRQVIESPLVFRTFYWYTEQERAHSFRDHRELLAACRAHDPVWAEAVIRSHISKAKHFVIGKLGPTPLERSATTDPES